MKEYTCIITLAIIFCLLIAVCCLYLQFRRARKRYSSTLIKNIRDHDRLVRELEQARIEKETIEKALETRLTATDKTTDETPILRIDITTHK